MTMATLILVVVLVMPWAGLMVRAPHAQHHHKHADTFYRIDPIERDATELPMR